MAYTKVLVEPCSAGCVDEDEEELPAPRATALARPDTALLAVLAIAAVVAIRAWPRSTHTSASNTLINGYAPAPDLPIADLAPT